MSRQEDGADEDAPIVYGEWSDAGGASASAAGAGPRGPEAGAWKRAAAWTLDKVKTRDGSLTTPSALPEDGAPSASLDHRKARAASHRLHTAA